MSISIYICIIKPISECQRDGGKTQRDRQRDRNAAFESQQTFEDNVYGTKKQ